LLIVLDLFLELAGVHEQTWQTIVTGIRRDKETTKNKEVSNATGQNLDRVVNAKLKSLKECLRVEWRSTGEPWQAGEEDLGTDKKWLHLQQAKSSSPPTVSAIHDCLKYQRLAKSISSASRSEGTLSVVQISNALKRMSELDLFKQLLVRNPQGAAHRHFALDFSACNLRSHQSCRSLVEQKLKPKFPQPADTAKHPPGSTKRPDTALSKKLNDLMEALLPTVKTNFEARRRHEQKHIHVPLKATIRPADWALQEEPDAQEPGPEDLMGLAGADDSQLLLIWEEGGAGKTSLAYEIASWGLERRLADHPLLPYFLDLNGFELTSTESLSQHLVTGLDRLGGPDLREDDVKNLLRHKRLLLIVDHFSELTKEQRDWVREKLPARSLVLLTSRLADHKDDFVRNSWKVTEIKPQRLQNQELLDFFKEYVERSNDIREDVRKVLLDPEHSLRWGDLLQRMVGHKPVTVLLAWLVMKNAIKHIEERLKSPDGPAVLPPNSIPELMEVYVRECCGDKSRSLRRTRRQAQDCKWNPDIILPSLKALALEAHCQNEAYHPNNFDTELAKRAFASVRIAGKPLDDDVQQGLLDALVGELTLVTCIDSNDTPDSKVYRISLDPLADYLAALKQQEIWQNSGNDAVHFKQVDTWLTRIKGLRELGKNKEDSALVAVDHMRGFLAACRDCYMQWRRHPDHINLTEPQQWRQCLNDFADLAKIDPQQERIMEAEYLIRRHAYDLEYNNFELRAKAIAELSAYAQEIKAIPLPGKPRDPAQTIPEMKVALQPLALTLAEPTISTADRAAAAEALGHIGGERAAEILIQRIDASEERSIAVRRAAAEALGLVEREQDDHWERLVQILASKANHLHGETDQDVIAAKLPLLQGASRGLQRLAPRCNILPVWGKKKIQEVKVPMLTLTIATGAVTTEMVPIKVWQLPLPDGMSLELVKIPGGKFKMGSPKQEEGRDSYDHFPVATEVEEKEEALRLVEVSDFLMARTLINQAQWRAVVANLPKIELELDVDPAVSTGDDLPVESVSWDEAKEWCARLNQYLQKQPGQACMEVKLPTEAQWEYACRAGSSTPFHFGDTIDSSWANYNGKYIYGSGKIGDYRKGTTPVGFYGLVNKWGLADMHGNVLEWVEDFWHSSPALGPSMLEPMEDLPEEIKISRVLRGGSWHLDPSNCSSVFRVIALPDNHLNIIGFRVCCITQS
jgi:formylglycine-generating enzyme required for sulfatase activity